jgi:hypothetical protein
MRRGRGWSLSWRRVRWDSCLGIAARYFVSKSVGAILNFIHYKISALNKVTSFVGEHSVGLSIAPVLKKVLHNKYQLVVPIFPWMSREGGNISRIVHATSEFNIVGLYPRRPKISTTDQDNIYLTINEEIILGTESGRKLGIPIIAGIPIARDFWELGESARCMWLKLDFNSVEEAPFQICHKNGKCPNKEVTDRILATDHEILDFLCKDCKSFNIDEALEAFKQIKMDSLHLAHYSRFSYMGGYKPIYFLIR